MTTFLLLTLLAATPQQAATGAAVPPPTPATAPAPDAPTLSEVTTLRAEVYLLRLRDLQRQAAELDRFRLEVEAAVEKETGKRIDWATGALVDANAEKGKATP